jgi:hypothetical protein
MPNHLPAIPKSLAPISSGVLGTVLTEKIRKAGYATGDPYTVFGQIKGFHDSLRAAYSALRETRAYANDTNDHVVRVDAHLGVVDAREKAHYAELKAAMANRPFLSGRG